MKIVFLIAPVAILLYEVDLYGLRIYAYDFSSYMDPEAVVKAVADAEPAGCTRLRGPIGAEDAV